MKPRRATPYPRGSWWKRFSRKSGSKLGSGGRRNSKRDTVSSRTDEEANKSAENSPRESIAAKTPLRSEGSSSSQFTEGPTPKKKKKKWWSLWQHEVPEDGKGYSTSLQESSAQDSAGGSPAGSRNWESRGMRSEVESMSNVSQVGMSPARTVAGDDEQLTEESVDEETTAVESSAKPAEESVGDKTASGSNMAQSQNVHLQSSSAADLHSSSMASLGNGTDKRGGDGSNRIPTVNMVTSESQPPTGGSRQVTERMSNSYDRTAKVSPQDLNRPRLNSRSSRIEALLNETSEASEERPHAGFSSARQAAAGEDKEWGFEALSSAKSLPPAEKSSRPHSAVAKRRRSSPSKLVFLAESALHPDEDYTTVGNVRASPDQVQQNSEAGAGVAPVEPTPPPGSSMAGAGVAPVKPTLPSGHTHANALLKEEQQQQSKSPEEEERPTAKTSRSNREHGTSDRGGDGDAAHNEDMVEPHEDLDVNPSSSAEADANGNHNDGKDDGDDGDVESDDGGAADEDDEDADNADDEDSQKADQKTPSKGGIPGNPHTPGRVVVKQGKRGGGKGTASQGGQSGRTSGKRTARRSNTSSRKSRRKAENKEAAELEGKEDSREPGRQVDEGATHRAPSTRRTTEKSSSQGTESTTESESAPRHRQQEEETGSEKSSQEGSGSPTGSSRENKTDSHTNRKKMRNEKKPPAVKKERTRGRAVTEADNSKGRQRETDEVTRRQQMQRQRQREWQLAHDRALKDHNWMPMSILRSQPVSAHYLSHLRLIQEERRQDMEAMRNSKCGPIGYEWSNWADPFSQTARKQWLQGLIDSRRVRAMKQALWSQKKKEQGALTGRSVSELSSCSSSQISTPFPAKWGCVVFCSSCMRGEVPRSVELQHSIGHHYKLRAKEKSEHTNRMLVKGANRTLVKNTNRTPAASTDRTLAKTTQGGVVHSSRQRVKRKQVLDTRWQKREPKVKGGQVRKRRQQRKRRKQKLGTGRRSVRGKRVHSHPVSAPPAPAQERGASSDVGKIGEDATKAAAAVDLKRRLSLDLKAIKSQAEARGATKLKVSSRKTESTKETSQSVSQSNGYSQGKSSKAKRPTRTAVIQLPRSSAAESNKPTKKADDRERKETAKSMGKKGGRGGSPSISHPVKESNSSSKRGSKRGQQQGQQGSTKGRPRTTRTARRKVRKPKPLTSSLPSPRRSKTHRSESDSSDEEDDDARSHSHLASGKGADNTRTRLESERNKQQMRKGAKSRGDGVSTVSLSRDGKNNRSSDDEQDGKGKGYASLLSTSSQTSDDIRERSGKGQKHLLQKRSKSADRGLLSGSAGKGGNGKQLFASTPGTPKHLKMDRHDAAADSENGKKKRSKAHPLDETVSLTVSEVGKTVSLTVTIGSPGVKRTGGGENAEPDRGMGAAKDGSPAPIDIGNDRRQGGDGLTLSRGEIAELHRGTGAIKDVSPGPIDIASADRQAGNGRTGGEMAAEGDKGTGAKPKDEVPVPIDIASAHRQGGDVVTNKNLLPSALPIDVQQSTISTGLSTPASLPNPLGSSSQTAAPFEDMQDYVQENIEIDGSQGTKYDAQGGGRGDVGSGHGAAVELRLSSSPTGANAMKLHRTPSQEEVLEVQDWKMARFFSSADAQSLSPSPAPKTRRKASGGSGDASFGSDNEGKYGQLRLITSSSPLDPSTPRSTKSVRPSSSNPQLSAVVGSDADTVSSQATTTSRKSGKSSPASFVVRVTVDRELYFSSGPRKTVSEGATPGSGHGSTGGGKTGTHQMLIDAPGSVAKSESAVAVRTLSQTLSNLAVSGKLPRDEGGETNSGDGSADGASPSSQPALPTEQLTRAPPPPNRPYSAFSLGRVSRNAAQDELQGPNTSRSQDGTRQSYGTHPPNRDWNRQSPSATSGYASPQVGKQEGKRRVHISEKVFHSDGTVLPQKDMEEEGPSEVQSSANHVHFGAEKGVHDDENERQGYESDFEEQYASDFESESTTRTSHATRRATPFPDVLEMLNVEDDDEDQPGYPQSAVQHGSMTPGRFRNPSRPRLQAKLRTSKSQPITPRQNLRPKNDWKNNSG